MPCSKVYDTYAILVVLAYIGLVNVDKSSRQFRGYGSRDEEKESKY
jgi:hypothetical protein